MAPVEAHELDGSELPLMHSCEQGGPPALKCSLYIGPGVEAEAGAVRVAVLAGSEERRASLLHRLAGRFWDWPRVASSAAAAAAAGDADAAAAGWLDRARGASRGASTGRPW